MLIKVQLKYFNLWLFYSSLPFISCSAFYQASDKAAKEINLNYSLQLKNYLNSMKIIFGIKITSENIFKLTNH